MRSLIIYRQYVYIYTNYYENGGGGGNRTRVRQSFSLTSTCIAHSIIFNFYHPKSRA